MVKAPRSKGCRVCANRRVKCDQRRPFCLRCERSNRQCPGYESISIVDEGPSVSQLYRNLSRGAEAGSDNAGHMIEQNLGRDLSETSEACLNPWNLYENQAPFGNSFVPSGSPRVDNDGNVTRDIERSALVAILSPNAYQSQLLSSFMNSISTANLHSISLGVFSHSVWLSAIAARTEVSPTLTWSIRATSLAHLGRQMQDNNMIANSRKMYSRALLQLNRSLQDPIEGLASDTLCATVMLSFYEMMTCTEKYSWIRHAGGAGNLIRVRGPQRHRNGFDSTIFLACRHMIIMEAFATRKPCFLTEPAWKTLSLQLQEQANTQNQFHAVHENILQITIQIPGFIAEVIDYISSRSRDKIVLENLIHQGHQHRADYKRIMARLNETLGEIGHQPVLIPSTTDDKVFPMVYHYPGNVIGSHYCSFWSVTIMLNIVLIGLETEISGTSSREAQSAQSGFDVDTSGLPSDAMGGTKPLLWLLTTRAQRHIPPLSRSLAGTDPSVFPTISASDTTIRRQLYMAENIEYAREICRSIEDMSTTMRLGPLILIYALRTALGVLAGDDEQKWILAKLKEIGKIFGIARNEVLIFNESGSVDEFQFS